MYGTREDLCRMLNEQYPAETPLNLIIWTPADIEALADGMEYSFSEHDVRAVLERMDTIPEEQRLESGVSAGLVMALIDQVKENGHRRAHNDPVIQCSCIPETSPSGSAAGHHDGGRGSPARRTSAIDATRPDIPAPADRL